MRSQIVLAFTGAFMAVVGCSPAPGDPIAATSNADRIFDADCPSPGPTSGPDTFDSIYNELIGPKSAAQCQNPACHGGSSEQGAFKMKNTKQEAYDGMKDYGLLLPNPAAADAGAPPNEENPPAVSGLLRVIVPLASTGKPKMPRELCGNRPLTAPELERIRRWGRAGAPNN
jgi:hypothetical protein